MHRTTVHLDADLEILLKLEAQRQKKSMAQLLREVVRAHFADRPRRLPPGGGEFSSARGDVADRAEELLDLHGFGRE